MNRQDLFVLPKSKADARVLGLSMFFTGMPCSHGHIAARYVSTTNCVECQVAHARITGGWKARPSRGEYFRGVKALVENKGGVLLSTDYESAKSKLRVECGLGHQFEATADNLKRQWCPACRRDRHSKRMEENFRSIESLDGFARREHNGKCLAVSPVSAHTRVLWRCSTLTHEPFVATVSHVIHSKTWCPACDADRRRLNPPKPRIPREAVEKLIRERGGEIVHILGERGWTGLETRLQVRCADAHEWNVTAANLMNAGSWCPNCQLKGERITRAIFEKTFGTMFPKSKPKWLALKTGRKLELDGFSDVLKLAFEYQGPHHFTEDSVKARDALKRQACVEYNVRLVEVVALKRPFPPTNVLAKVVEAFQIAGILHVPALPTVDVFAREMEGLQLLGQEKGGKLVSVVYCGSEPHEWHCGNPRHGSWWAEPWRIRNGNWCPSCAGNRSLGTEGLQRWGRSHGLELLDTDYSGTRAAYRWRCEKGGHIIRRSKGNIQQSLTQGRTACHVCDPGVISTTSARKRRADDFAISILPTIKTLKQDGFVSLEALAVQLNKRCVPTALGAKWYASTVKNILNRASAFSDGPALNLSSGLTNTENT